MFGSYLLYCYRLYGFLTYLYLARGVVRALVSVCTFVYVCAMCVQPSTIRVELPGFLEPGALPANLVNAIAPTEGVLTYANPSQEHEHCPPQLGEYTLFVVRCQ